MRQSLRRFRRFRRVYGDPLAMLWVPLTIAAAFLQNARSALQQRLKMALGPADGGLAATFARFGYALPFAALFFALALGLEGLAALTTAPTPAWAAWTLTAALAQIGGTWALLRSFDFANFAVGAAFSKTEPLLAALFGGLLLAELPTPLAGLGVVVGLCGVAALTLDAKTARLEDPRPAAWGVAAAALFGLSAVGYRAASLSLETGSVAFRAAATLLLATLLQTLIMGGWMALFDRGAGRAALQAWRPGLWIGAAGAGASAGWFAAMTLEPAAHVRALAQIELVFAIAAAAMLFGQKPSGRELADVALIGLGAALLLAGAL